MGRSSIIILEGEPLTEADLLSRVFRTLGEPNRLRMLELLLARGAMSQTEMIEGVGISQSRASEHLSCLVWCGFVSAEKDGRVVKYRIADGRAVALLDLARAFLADNKGAIGSCRVLETDLNPSRPPNSD